MLVKKFLGKDENSKFVSKLLDNLIFKFEYKWKIDVLEIRPGPENLIMEENRAKLFLDMKNPFILNHDEKASSVIIMSGLERIMIRKIFGQIPKYLEDLLVLREIVKKGHDDKLYYYSYISLMEYRPHVVEEFSDFLEMSLFWLCFAEKDEYNTESLQNIIASFKYNRDFEKKTKTLFKLLSKDLWDKKNLEKAVKAYEKL